MSTSRVGDPEALFRAAIRAHRPHGLPLRAARPAPAVVLLRGADGAGRDRRAADRHSSHSPSWAVSRLRSHPPRQQRVRGGRRLTPSVPSVSRRSAGRRFQIGVIVPRAVSSRSRSRRGARPGRDHCVAPATSMYSMKRISAGSAGELDERHSRRHCAADDDGVDLRVLKPLTSARSPARTWAWPGRCASASNLSGRSVSRLTVTRSSPAARSAPAWAARSMPFVVIATSWISGLVAMMRIRFGKVAAQQRLSAGNRTRSTPTDANTSSSSAEFFKARRSPWRQPRILLPACSSGTGGCSGR